MKQKNKILVLVLSIVVLLILMLGTIQFFELQKAHSTFDNYYAFRDCTQLIQKTDTSGVCKTQSGAMITIVEINNKWYLQGDGPGVW
jgi:hypothetical protein